MKYLHVTQVLVLSGVTDYSFVTEEAKWRGSEVHRAVHLANLGTLKRASVPKKIEGYFAAFERFKSECRFMANKSECELESKALRLRGRMDARGFMKGQSGIFDFKTSEIRPAVALQLVLYGHMGNPGVWLPRYGVQLKADGSYRLKTWTATSWPADLATAMACIRIAHWRLANGLAKV